MVVGIGSHGLSKAYVLVAVLSQVFGVKADTRKCWKDTPCDSRFDETAFPGPWEDSILAAATRTITPRSVVETLTKTVNGDLIPTSRAPYDPTKVPLVLAGNGSQVVFDFGQEVGGLVTLIYTVSRNDEIHIGGDDDDDDDDDAENRDHSTRDAPTSRKARIGLAFSESSDFIGQWSDASNGAFQGPDGAIYAEIDEPGETTYTMPDASLRGGFRYLTVFLEADGDGNAGLVAALHNVTLDIAFQPTWPNLRAYQGYFDCDDPLLNRIWYAGAYTLQTNAVPPTTGRHVPFLKTGWANDGLLGPGHTILVDGAKRDRAVWPGDMGVAVPSLFVSTGDMESVKNALQTMYDNQNPDGSFPEAGPPLLQQGSDTYHMWTMIGTYNYVLYTNDTTFLARNWAGYQRAMSFITAKQVQVDSKRGLLNATGVRDWARLNVGGNMTEAQVILYQTLTTGTQLGTWLGTNATGNTSTVWAAAAEHLRNITLATCYDPQVGLFRDNALPSSKIYPQDANALALAFGMTSSSVTAVSYDVDTFSVNISDNLVRNWQSAANPYPVTPELPGHVSPFISSWEVRGHFLARETDRALKLVRSVWGGYLDRLDGSQSSLVEGHVIDPGSEGLSFGYRWNRGYGGAHNDTAVAASYTSHSHGWSAGPTSALTEFVLGLSVTGVAGSTWQFAPQMGGRGSGTKGIGRAEGGFITPLGKFQASWVCSCFANGTCDDIGKSDNSFEATVNTPQNTSGVIILPIAGIVEKDAMKSGAAVRVVLNNFVIQNPQIEDVGNRGKDKASVAVLHVQGGSNTVKISRVLD
ncbi:bacterial alpha-L-rhamnosidase domain protein [Sporothrix schenckii 1099-18]|uniref:Bacterial alpha-L-rhamnosidase domain protein n=1 Tax=Sporothrix schenckii 1099-18 TaxID=1397361 RepID=A0A0F2LY77_SPOSC|nr:bacterial alpha-L-rhamnosidase domain protein [Sporothrix schenckii 1099-18]KJR82427.1 bacterial alpha-L-rhamnosidase domain protein [Sporothrix schenckii 1099-18]